MVGLERVELVLLWHERSEGGVSAPTAPTAPTAPAGGSGTSPDGTSVPSAPSIVDNSLAVWTIGSGLRILQNGSQVGGGTGFQILWLGNTIYVLGDDSRWYRWTGSNWTFYSDNAPA